VRRQTDTDDSFAIPLEVVRRAAEATQRGMTIRITPDEIIEMMTLADLALNGSSNDSEHDALYDLRVRLSEFYEDPSRWS